MILEQPRSKPVDEPKCYWRRLVTRLVEELYLPDGRIIDCDFAVYTEDDGFACSDHRVWNVSAAPDGTEDFKELTGPDLEAAKAVVAVYIEKNADWYMDRLYRECVEDSYCHRGRRYAR